MNPIYSRRVRRIPILTSGPSRPRVHKGGMFLPMRSKLANYQWVRSASKRKRETTMTDLIPHARSAGVRNPRLDMFKVPPMDLSMSSRRFVKINPFNTGINPVTFQVDPQEDFVDLSESYFEVELTVKKDNNTNLLTADLIGLANNLAHTLFKQINIRLNGTLISPQTDTYHYKAFIEALLNHNHDDGKTLLTPEGWYNSLDVPGDNDADEYTANMLDTTHADYAALSDKKRLWWIVEYNSWVEKEWP